MLKREAYIVTALRGFNLLSGVVQTCDSRWSEDREFILTCQCILNYHCLVFAEVLTVIVNT